MGAVWHSKKKSGKKISGVYKFFTILFDIAGFVLFILPIIVGVGYTAITSINRKIELNKFDTKVEIESSSEFVDGFEVDGVRYVRTDFIHHNMGDNDTERFCAFVFPNGDYAACYAFECESGHDAYYVDHYNGCFVCSDDYEEVVEYYFEEAPLIAHVHIYGDEEVDFIVDDFDRDRLIELNGSYDDDMNFECDVSDIDFSFYISGYTADGTFGVNTSFDVVDGQIILSHVTGGGHMRGHIVDEDNASYLIDIVDDYVDYDFE